MVVLQLITEVLLKFLKKICLGASMSQIHELMHAEIGKFWAILTNGLVNVEMSIKKWCEYT